MVTSLRPLTLGELLDRSFSLYRANFRTFLALMAPPSVFAAGIGALGDVFQGAAGGRLRGWLESDETAVTASVLLAFFYLMLVVGYLVFYVAAVGATTSAVSEIYFGREASTLDAYRRVRGRLGRLVLVMLQVGLRAGGVMLLGVMLVGGTAAMSRGSAALAGILLAILILVVTIVLCAFLTLRYGLSVAAVVLEPITARQALRRSVELTRGRLWRVFLLGLFAAVIAYITLLVFQMPFMIAAVVAGPGTIAALALSLIGTVVGALANAASGAIMVVALALLYYDARVRTEGLDLQLMMQGLDGLATPVAPSSPSAATLPS